MEVKMKKIAALLSLVLAIVFFLSFSGIGNSQDQDKKVVKKTKQTVQNLLQKNKSCDPKLCAEKHASRECTGHEAEKCDPKLCAEKHANGECTGHKAGKCEKKNCTGVCPEQSQKVEAPQKK
jgi:hypothetical protein